MEKQGVPHASMLQCIPPMCVSTVVFPANLWVDRSGCGSTTALVAHNSVVCVHSTTALVRHNSVVCVRSTTALVAHNSVVCVHSTTALVGHNSVVCVRSTTALVGHNSVVCVRSVLCCVANCGRYTLSLLRGTLGQAKEKRSASPLVCLSTARVDRHPLL